MPGYAWSSEAEYLSARCFYDYHTFSQVVQDLQYIQFSVKAERDRAIASLKSMRRVVAVQPKSRFPADTALINVDHPIVNAYWVQLVSSLDFADRQTEKGRDLHAALDRRILSNSEDAKRSFHTAIRGLVQLTQGREIEQSGVVGIWTQASFETTHGLVWTT